jgi:hypothetical protein
VVRVLCELAAPGLTLLHTRFLSSFPSSLFQSCPPGRCPDGHCELQESFSDQNKCGRCSGMQPWLEFQRFDRDLSRLSYGNIDCRDLFHTEKGPVALVKLNIDEPLPREINTLSQIPMGSLIDVMDAMSVFVECFSGFDVVELDAFRTWLVVVLNELFGGLAVNGEAGLVKLKRALVGLLGCRVVADTCPSAQAVRGELLAEIGIGEGGTVPLVEFVPPAANPKFSGNLVANLCEGYWLRKQHPEAVAKGRENLAIKLTTLPAEHAGVAEALHDLASALEPAQEREEADATFREAIRIHKVAHPGGSPELARTLCHFGMFLDHREEQHAEAGEALREALRVRKAVHPPGHADIAQATFMVAAHIFQDRKFVESIALLEESLAMYQAVSPPRIDEMSKVANFLTVARGELAKLPAASRRLQARQSATTAAVESSEPQPRVFVSKAERERIERELLEEEGGDGKKGGSGKKKKK